MRLIDAENIDIVILENSNICIEHRRGDDVYCVIGAKEVKAIPVEEIEKAWESIADVAEGSYVDIEEIKFWIAKWLDKDEAEL